MKMPRLSLALVGSMVVGASLVLSACTTPKINTRSQSDPSVNLASYKTYGFVAEPGTNRGGYSTPITTYFKTAITREMNARGYTYSENSPDLLINWNTNAKEQVDIRSTPSMSYGYGYYGYRGGKATCSSLLWKGDSIGDDDQSTHEADSQGLDRRTALWMMPTIE